jgi:hypothetical protein
MKQNVETIEMVEIIMVNFTVNFFSVLRIFMVNFQYQDQDTKACILQNCPLWMTQRDLLGPMELLLHNNFVDPQELKRSAKFIRDIGLDICKEEEDQSHMNMEVGNLWSEKSGYSRGNWLTNWTG